MTKQPEIYLKHMLMAVERIGEYVKGYDKDFFKEDNKTIDAVIRQFEILGEAAGRVPEALTRGSPITWSKIVGMRHKLIHDYMGVNVDIVWETAVKGLAPLKKWLQEKIKE